MPWRTWFGLVGGYQGSIVPSYARKHHALLTETQDLRPGPPETVDIAVDKVPYVVPHNLTIGTPSRVNTKVETCSPVSRSLVPRIVFITSARRIRYLPRLCPPS